MTPQPHSKTHILHLNRTEGSGATSINETSCWQTRGTAKRPDIWTAQKSRDTSSNGRGRRKSLAQIQNHIQKDSHTREGWSSEPRGDTHVPHTQHFISYLLIFVPSQGFPMTKRRGWNSSHVYHVSMSSPQTPLTLKCTFVPGWNSINWFNMTDC